MGNPLCLGLTVIPPLNFSTSKEKGSPNKGVVKCRADRPVITVSNSDQTKLRAVRETLPFFTSESTAKMTSVMFVPAIFSNDIITTCKKQKISVRGKKWQKKIKLRKNNKDKGDENC